MPHYFLFFDETGDHGLTYVDPNFPLFLLCGCLFEESALSSFGERMNAIRQDYWKTDDVIFHSREIRKCEGPFQSLFDLSLKEKFYRDLNQAIKEATFSIIAAGIRKDAFIKQFGKLGHDPYEVCFSFIVERLVLYLNEHDQEATCTLVFERRGRKEDHQIIAHFNKIRDAGTGSLDPKVVQETIAGCELSAKWENQIGLQCADLCAYPLARSMILKGEPSKAADIVKRKTLPDGLKIFP